ncbi:putative disintegrin and metalloproteinase with thrombospondin motif [Dirofilaria immitis]
MPCIFAKGNDKWNYKSSNCGSNKADRYLLFSEKSKFVPSPMEMKNLIKPETKRIIKHSCAEISSASLPEYIDPPIEQPQRAEIAYYRCQTGQVPAY